MAFFHSLPSVKSIASLTVLESSSSMEDNTKDEKILGGQNLSGCFVSHPDLLMTIF
jgi:hypothetical protein